MRPNCKACAKPLRPYRFRLEALLKSANEYRQKAIAADDKPNRDYYNRRAAEDELTAASTKPTEQWGGYGDNFFCGLTCAYTWAVRQCKKERP